MDPDLPHVDLDSHDTASDEEYRFACPVCGRVARTQTDLRCHLEVSHRKSAVVTALLERRREPRPA